MVDMVLRTLEEEKAMMVDMLQSAIKVQECRSVFAFLIDDVAGFEVKVCSVEVDSFGKVCDAETYMTKLEHLLRKW